MEKEFNDESNKLPVIFIGTRVLGGRKEINRHLEKELLRYRPGQKSAVRPEDIDREIRDKIESLKILPVVAAGAIDGLNPCAFGAIIFLISYLSVSMKRKTREVFITGISFSLGVFIAYFLLGLGLIKMLYLLKGFEIAGKILYFLIGFLTLVLAVLSFRDYISAVRGRSAVILKLPGSFLFRILDVMQKHSQVKYFAVFAFFTGAVISFLELACTGQIYLPTIIYMLKTAEHKTTAVAYLGLYSFVFIIPLLIIFFLFLFGVRSGKMEEFGTRYFKTVKLFNTLVFLFFSGYLVAAGVGIF
jgi:cytochrome c biogenesis protein CcdA